MIQGVFDHGAMPALERMLTFTSARQKALSHNIANLSTPNFRPVDLDPELFQHQLGDAIDRRRQSRRPVDGDLQLRNTRQVQESDGTLAFTPQKGGEGILYHDRNNRDLERTMQSLAENTLVHNTAIDLLRSEFELLRSAIRERP
ncbi:flagellar basal body rod protein FlgB [Mucisphaera calidilacus]|uniref:Flagellar basal body rod protein FlgB n=1 Tax=Mucisphaera calidilacus TaxID=2527982 RepID=A0A518BYY8_9BACT|nr:hypothetical protein [Mucisphaera calidilacus]QDU72190.1 Flagellar basal body rod protein FlgB [Mucisphaera calidilacus]